MKKQCSYSGANSRWGVPEGTERYTDPERGRMIVCPGCGRHLKLSRAGLCGADLAVPQHKAR